MHFGGFMGGWEAIICTNAEVNTLNFSDRSSCVLITCQLVWFTSSLITFDFSVANNGIATYVCIATYSLQ